MNLSQFQDVCNVFVLYDGPASRSRAMAACDSLVNQLWEHVELKFHWWRADFLADLILATHATRDAVTADFLIVASENRYAPSPALEQWFQSWLHLRSERQGALVDVTTASVGPTFGLTEARQRFFREICRRGNFDYLTTLAEVGLDSPKSPAVLRELPTPLGDLREDFQPPSHFGLNE